MKNVFSYIFFILPLVYNNNYCCLFINLFSMIEGWPNGSYPLSHYLAISYPLSYFLPLILH